MPTFRSGISKNANTVSSSSICWAYTDDAAMSVPENDNDAVPEPENDDDVVPDPADDGYAADSEVEEDEAHLTTGRPVCPSGPSLQCERDLIIHCFSPPLFFHTSGPESAPFPHFNCHVSSST